MKKKILIVTLVSSLFIAPILANAFLPLLIPFAAAAVRSLVISSVAKNVFVAGGSIVLKYGAKTVDLNLVKHAIGVAGTTAALIAAQDSFVTRYGQTAFTCTVGAFSVTRATLSSARVALGPAIGPTIYFDPGSLYYYSNATNPPGFYSSSAWCVQLSPWSAFIAGINGDLSIPNADGSANIPKSAIKRVAVNFARTNPAQFDLISSISPQSPNSSTSQFSNGDSVVVYSNGTISVNGNYLNKGSYIDSLGNKHVLTLDKNGDVLNNGQPAVFTASNPSSGMINNTGAGNASLATGTGSTTATGTGSTTATGTGSTTATGTGSTTATGTGSTTNVNVTVDNAGVISAIDALKAQEAKLNTDNLNNININLVPIRKIESANNFMGFSGFISRVTASPIYSSISTALVINIVSGYPSWHFHQSLPIVGQNFIWDLNLNLKDFAWLFLIMKGVVMFSASWFAFRRVFG